MGTITVILVVMQWIFHKKVSFKNAGHGEKVFVSSQHRTITAGQEQSGTNSKYS